MISKITNLFHRIVPEALNIRPVWVTLESGIKILIDSKLTLNLFIELFLTDQYIPVFKILPRIDFILDLGANRGLFALLAFHFLRKRNKGEDPKIICVEAQKNNYNKLLNHIKANSLIENIIPINGAVCGQRSGFVNFFSNPHAHVMGLIISKRTIMTRKVPIIDLAKYINFPKIDILKIDIEGSEEAFLNQYPDILEKTQIIIAEFHLDRINYSNCQNLLERYGFFFNQRTFHYQNKLYVDIYTRNSNKTVK